MQNRELNRQLQRLRSLLARTSLATEDIELQGHWGRYVCVVAAGFVENGLRAVFSDFASSASSPKVARYVSERLDGVTNPKAQRFVDVARAFSPEWEAELDSFLNMDAEVRKNAIDSIMANRNQIAHGRTVGITVAQVSRHLDRCVEVLAFIERQCAGNAHAD